MKSKVKVRTADLLETVKARRVALQTEYAESVRTYEQERDEYRAAVVKALQSEKVRMQDPDYMPDRSYSNVIEVRIGVPRPHKPTLSTGGIDRLIATLEMAADETIAISAEDAADYLG